ncbi:hypothetical protein HDC91_003557 [Mucilaginibacter sp. AK015]|nr:hypothetical protein [Mucilaginibacter sp. AK015]
MTTLLTLPVLTAIVALLSKAVVLISLLGHLIF